MQHQVRVVKSSGVGQAAAVGVNGQVGAAASLPINDGWMLLGATSGGSQEVPIADVDLAEGDKVSSSSLPINGKSGCGSGIVPMNPIAVVGSKLSHGGSNQNNGVSSHPVAKKRGRKAFKK
ncbi:hypothetical protein Acr_07g0001260 [Actinidia rufa]|uniref:Uncharacterized protein n=1 Tax=Actinidia rufa TaxID=165716 RepID=A0A7J0EVA5_9ERIC|nr:hypothetical protein Acr_07g0001260 [Actinidia rufa]